MPTKRDPLLGYAEVAAMTGLSTMTLYGYQSKGQMPPPDAYEADRPRWHRSTIRDWRAVAGKRVAS